MYQGHDRNSPQTEPPGKRVQRFDSNSLPTCELTREVCQKVMQEQLTVSRTHLAGVCRDLTVTTYRYMNSRGRCVNNDNKKTWQKLCQEVSQ